MEILESEGNQMCIRDRIEVLSEPVPEKLFHQVRQQEFVRVIRIHVRQKEGVLPIPDQAVLGAVWELSLIHICISFAYDGVLALLGNVTKR